MAIFQENRLEQPFINLKMGLLRVILVEIYVEPREAQEVETMGASLPSSKISPTGVTNMSTVVIKFHINGLMNLPFPFSSTQILLMMTTINRVI